MDRPLDDTIAERTSRSSRGGYRGRGSSSRGGRNGYGKVHYIHADTFTRANDLSKWNARSENSDIDADWVHDKYEDDPHTKAPRDDHRRNRRHERISPEPGRYNQEARLRVDNLHYDLTSDDLEELFNRIAPVISLTLRFDRAGRSTGTAYVSYGNIAFAERAIREFDGANAAGQPIRVALLPSGPADRNGGRNLIEPRNPFDTAVRPGRSLFERIETPNGGRGSRDRRSRSRSPRRSNVAKPAPDGVDRYVPGERGHDRRRRSRSRSPRRNRRSPPPRRGRGGGRRDDGGHLMVGGRPRKTQEELDAEMDDYFGGRKDDVGAANANRSTFSEFEPAAGAPLDEDVDMIT